MKRQSKRRTKWALALVGFFQAAMTLGCDGILGIEGFVIGCPEGCIDQTCVKGVCVGECEAGQKECAENWTLVCDDQGRWQPKAVCKYACSAGNCGCAPGQARCIENNTLETCDEHREWKKSPCFERTCVEDSDAITAECRGECAPGNRCLGNTPQTCNESGHWKNKAPCDIAQVCIDGSCGCLVGDRRCFENKTQTCNETGQWKDDETCNGKTCDPDTVTCAGDCVAGVKECNQDGKTPRRCNSKGIWQNDPPCLNACVNGICTTCAPGEVDCDGNTPRTCDTFGQWQNDGPCEGQTCNLGVCLGECAPGKRCLGNTPQTCNETGSWEGSTPCDAGQMCSGGTCNCIEGDLRCFDNTPQLCNASNAWEDLGARCMGQTCDPIIGCVGVCEVGTRQCQNANTAQTCNGLGAWDADVTCGMLGCVAGQCAVCQAGQIRCTGNTPQSCGMNGQWQDEAECVDQTCVAGTCRGNCAFGQNWCAGKWPITCDPFGVWQPVGPSCAANETCNQGQCAVACTPGAKRCAGDYPQTCASNGEWQSDGAPCGKCFACDPDTGMCRPEAEPLATCREPIAIAAGDSHTCALFWSGKVKCWGRNGGGQLGLGDTNDRGDQPGEMGANLPFVDLGLPPGVTVVEISAGAFHTCARTSDGQIKCWGDNYYGQLGLGDYYRRGDGPNEMGANLPFVDLGLPAGVTVAEISAGWYHTCARMSDGQIKCWGSNLSGQLGLGDSNPRGDQPGEMGANLEPVVLGLAPGVTVAEISTGLGHTCARTSDGRVKCWGYNDYGQLGLGDTNDRGDGQNEMDANLRSVELGLLAGVTVTEISLGYWHTCARTSDGQVKCWGFSGTLPWIHPLAL